MKTEKNHRDSRVNAEIVNLVMLRESLPLKKVKTNSEVENKKNQKNPTNFKNSKTPTSPKSLKIPRSQDPKIS